MKIAFGTDSASVRTAATRRSSRCSSSNGMTPAAALRTSVAAGGAARDREDTRHDRGRQAGRHRRRSGRSAQGHHRDRARDVRDEGRKGLSQRQGALTLIPSCRPSVCPCPCLCLCPCRRPPCRRRHYLRRRCSRRRRCDSFPGRPYGVRTHAAIAALRPFGNDLGSVAQLTAVPADELVSPLVRPVAPLARR